MNSIRKNLGRIAPIAKHNFKDTNAVATLERILEASASNLTSKWASGRKYARTSFAIEAFPNYPQEIVELSLTLDAMINILDDLLDEEIGKEPKTLYIVEMIRVLALYNSQSLSRPMLQAVSDYFCEILCIATTEGTYAKSIESADSFKNLVDSAIRLYDCLSLDFNIFVRLPLLKTCPEDSTRKMEQIVELGKILRALTLIKKDLKDIEYDKAKGTRNGVVLIISKNKKYATVIRAMIEHYQKRTKTETSRIDRRAIAEGFQKAIQRQAEEIDSLLNAW